MSDTLRYGLGPGGFVRMRLPEIQRSIFDSLRARTGIVFDESPNSLMGQFVPIFAERLAEEWERLEAAYYSAYPATANDVSLDLAVSYAGVTRLQPSPTSARVVLTGVPGTVVPARSEIDSTAATADGSTPPRFRLVDPVTISGATAATMTVEVPGSPAQGIVYYFDWNGVRASTVAPASPTSGAIAIALRDALIGVGATATSSGGRVTVASDGAFSGAISPSLTLISVGSPGRADAILPGPAELPAGALTRIVTPTGGWEAVTNPSAGLTGRLLEANDALRDRYVLGVFRLGAGTQPAIYANLQQDIAGVSSLAVFENNTDVTDTEGRPPHSVEVVIEGGDDMLIARRIRELKAAGITAHGNTLRTVGGEDGYQHPIRFSRPEVRDIWLRVTLTTTAEEAVPGDVASRAVAAILASGAKLQPGQDVILQRLAAAVFPATTGVARVTITAVALAPNSPPPLVGAYGTADISIGSRQKALFSLARVQVV